MTACFVTATGTDIGKTWVSAELLRHARANGRSARGFKPVVSGFPGPDLAATDSGVLLAAMGESVTDDAIAAISPWRFAQPLSPDMAAAREGRSIPFDDLIAFCRAQITGEGLTLIEGVGGVMVPLDDTHTVCDWMAALGLPVILVAGAYLGTISHTLTALAALDAAKIPVKALALNDRGDGPVPVAETASAIARFAPGVAIVPIGGEGDISALAALL